MNFLAHLYLSGNDTDLIIGNFIADAVKGRQRELHSIEINHGINLHRFIDTYTDAHPIVEESKKRLRPSYKKYSGVIVDVFYDHFLAAHWQRFSEVSLHSYSEKIYELLSRNKTSFPEKSQMILPYMIKYNWLVSYASLDGIEKVLTGMSRRTAFESNMNLATSDLKIHYTLFENEFLAFFPLLIQEIEKYKLLNSHK